MPWPYDGRGAHPHGLGNHAAIVSEDTTSLPLVENIRKMLEACRYTGFSNFDINSGTPGDYRVFEINLRQGRSNYYVTATGMNIARLVVEKWNDGGTDCVLNKNEVFWHHVPAQVAFHLHRGQRPRRPRQGAESAGQGRRAVCCTSPTCCGTPCAMPACWSS